MWQVVYEELKNEGLEIIAVALDTAGKAAVEARIRATDIAERPPVLGRLMGWSEELWSKQAPPTFTCLIDEAHVVAELYGMVNVPQGVWIDEQGRLVRPVESAGTSDVVRHLDRTSFELPEDIAAQGVALRSLYVDALRDWVHKGAASRYVMAPDEIRKRMRGPGEADVRAATHVRMGRHLYAQGALERAKHHFREAVRLCPDKWNYRRQSNMLDPESVGQLNAGPDFWAAIDALGDRPFYPPAELGAAG